MKVLVTGATGFIGNYVVEDLLNRNIAVITTSVNPAKVAAASWHGKTTHIPFDLAGFNNEIDYFDFFQRPEAVIHLAWEGLPNYKSSFHEEVNLPRHYSFLSNLVRNGLNNLTVTGTCFEYGMQEGGLREDMPAIPANSYGRAKNELRKQLEVLSGKQPFSFKWVRLFYMYGKGQNPNSLLSQLEKALAAGEPVFNMSGGQQVRDFLPVEKVAENIVRIALQDKVTGIINNCSGQPVTVQQFVEGYLKKNNKTIDLNLGYYPYPDYEPMEFWGDTSKLNEILNYE